MNGYESHREKNKSGNNNLFDKSGWENAYRPASTDFYFIFSSLNQKQDFYSFQIHHYFLLKCFMNIFRFFFWKRERDLTFRKSDSAISENSLRYISNVSVFHLKYLKNNKFHSFLRKGLVCLLQLDCDKYLFIPTSQCFSNLLMF